MQGSRIFSDLAEKVAQASGQPTTFAVCVLVVLVWAISGPIFGFSETWQLIINTGTTIVTFLMVFLIQNTQNRDGAAIQAKLDELIRAGAAKNSFIGIEHLTQEELEAILQKIEERSKHSRAADRAQSRANRKAKAAADRATGSD
jgi:low affinity Fe/Cu permease